LQQPDGGWEYQSGFGTDGASTAWAIQALLGDDAVVSAGLNFLTGLQEASGGVQYQAGFGAGTFTSAYALTALAQVPFPVGNFEGTFEEPQEPPVDQEDPTDPPTQDDEGEVLGEDNTDDEGGVLAATTLPDTGFEAVAPTTSLNTQETQTSSNTRLFLLLGTVVMGMGFGVSYLVKRLERHGKSERTIYEKT
jgi:hypothetical protein